jgi:hypothetical protein
MEMLATVVYLAPACVGHLWLGLDDEDDDDGVAARCSLACTQDISFSGRTGWWPQHVRL